MSLNIRETFNEAVNGAVLSETLEQGLDPSTVERERELKEFVLNQGRKDVEQEDSSVILDGYAQAKATEKALQEKQKKEQRNVQFMLDFMSEDMRELYDDIDRDIDAYAASRERQARLREYRENGDIDALKAMFVKDYDEDPDEVKNWSAQDVIDKSFDLEDQEELKQGELVERIKHNVAKYKKHLNDDDDLSPEKKTQYREALERLENKANAIGLNFDEAFNTAWEDDQENDKLYDIGRGEADDFENSSVSEAKTVIKEESIVATTAPTMDSGW